MILGGKKIVKMDGFIYQGSIFSRKGVSSDDEKWNTPGVGVG